MEIKFLLLLIYNQNFTIEFEVKINSKLMYLFNNLESNSNLEFSVLE